MGYVPAEDRCDRMIYRRCGASDALQRHRGVFVEQLRGA